MKKRLKSILVMVVVAGMVLPAAAFEGDYGKRGGQDYRPRRQQRSGPPRNAGMLMGAFLHDAMVAEVLAELTGKPVATFKEVTGRGCVQDIMANSGINPEQFRSAMDKKTLSLVEKLRQSGIVSVEQAAEITAQLNKPRKNRKQHREFRNPPVQ